MKQIYNPEEPTYEDVLRENGRLRGRLAREAQRTWLDGGVELGHADGKCIHVRKDAGIFRDLGGIEMLKGRIILDNGLEAAFTLGNATEAALEQEAAEVRRVTGYMDYTLADELAAKLKGAVRKMSPPDSSRTGTKKK